MIDKINDASVLNAVKILLSKQVKEDWWDELPKSVQQSVERGFEQAKRGETKSHEEVMKKHTKWL